MNVLPEGGRYQKSVGGKRNDTALIKRFLSWIFVVGIKEVPGVTGTVADAERAEEAEVSVKDILGEMVWTCIGLVMVVILFIYVKVLGGEIDV